jgi:hypothetical protein
MGSGALAADYPDASVSNVTPGQVMGSRSRGILPLGPERSNLISIGPETDSFAGLSAFAERDARGSVPCEHLCAAANEDRVTRRGRVVPLLETNVMSGFSSCCYWTTIPRVKALVWIVTAESGTPATRHPSNTTSSTKCSALWPVIRMGQAFSHEMFLSRTP